MDGYPDNWEELRTQTLKRDNYQCRNCGLTGGPHGDALLHAHHIVPRESGGNNSISNLATLCEECYILVHSQPSDSAGKSNTPTTENRNQSKEEDSDMSSSISLHQRLMGIEESELEGSIQNNPHEDDSGDEDTLGEF